MENLLINKKSHEEDKGGIQARKIEEKGKEKEEEKNCGQAGTPIEGSTRGPRGPKNIIQSC